LFSRFFIDRPIFATVVSIVIVLTGGVAVWTLPIAQYPQITPPSITVSTTYPGADARVVAESVAAPIEQQVNGVENMLYMSSQAANDGSYSLSVTFKPGVNLNFAQVLVQNRVNLALPQLPDVVRQIGVTTRKRNPDILLIVSLYSEDDPATHKPYYDQLYLSNYAFIYCADEIKRIDGVGDVFLFGQQDYSMRVWIDPDQLAARGMTAMDVVAAVKEQNIQVAAGQLGGPSPHPQGEGREGGQPYQFTLTTLGRLVKPEQFENIIIRTTPDGRIIRIKDIGYAEIAPKSQDVENKLDFHPSTGIAIFQLPDANALATADRIRAKMEELKKRFPPNLKYSMAYDTTPFVAESIVEVVKTLIEAIILVAIVVLIFLQSWRSTIIPLTAVPVAIIGTFAVMAVMGFSLNNLTLFGLVLAIGIVVDDAIVVVEAVEHHIEEGMTPKQAAIKAMEEVSGPVIAVALVLSAVFVPCAFITGITGQFFRQFALTIAVSTVLSALNSLTLSPALAALFLKPTGAKRDPIGRVLFFVLGWFFWLFNFAFRHTTNAYTRVVGMLLRVSFLVLIVYAAMLGLTYWGFNQLPTGYIPTQDKGYLLVSLQMPDATALERTKEVVNRADQILHEEKGVGDTISISGQSFVLGAFGPNFGQFFVPLKPFSERETPDMTSAAIADRLTKKISKEVPEARLAIFGPPPVAGLGSGGGFKFIVEDRGENDLKKLQDETDKLVALGNRLGGLGPDGRALEAVSAPPGSNQPIPPLSEGQTHDLPKLKGLMTIFTVKSPQKYFDLNRDQCERLGVNPSDVFSTLQIYLGSLYANDFNLYGRTWQVNVQAKGEFRNHEEDVRRLMVRNKTGGMVPLGTVGDVTDINGPLILTRYNMYPAAAITGDTMPGVSSGDAIKMMEALANQNLPKTMAYEWTEITYIQQQSGSTAMMLFALGVLGVFLVLAALYESWALPLAVILVVPMCLLSSITGVWLSHTFWATAGDINIFTQIGFVVLVGLASKNAILIVEFAKMKRDAGLPRREATLEAVKLRLRPILMTSFAFILGVVPLMVSKGAGWEMRQTLGIAVFSGMLGVTLFGIFLTPVFFYVSEWFSELWPFNTPEAKHAGKMALDLLTFAYVRRLGGRLWHWAAEIAQERRPAHSGQLAPGVAGDSRSESPTMPPIQSNGDGNGAHTADAQGPVSEADVPVTQK
jgi:multidrug efflux pump